VAQTCLSESGGRVTSNNPVDWSTKRGWYFDLPTVGESESDSILGTSGSFSPPPSLSKSAVSVVKLLMEFNALNGSRLKRRRLIPIMITK
jgi:hypothetical protein